MTELTPEERLQLTQRLADNIIDVIGNHQHRMALDALLAVHRVIAKRYECCTTAAADACFNSAVELAQHAAEQRAQKEAAEQRGTASEAGNCTDMNNAKPVNVLSFPLAQASEIHVDESAAHRVARSSCGA